MRTEKIFLIIAVGISSASMFVGIPIIGTHTGGEQLALVTFTIMFNSLLGVFDIVRPIVTRLQAKFDCEISLACLLRTSIPVGLLLGILGSIVLLLMDLSFMGMVEISCFSVGILVFCVMSGFWGILDASGLVGTAQLYRALTTAAFVAVLAVQAYNETLGNSALLLLICLICLALIMAFISLEKGLLKGTGGATFNFKEFAYLFLQNVAKLPLDFADRFIAAKLLPVGIYASYGMIYEYVSKFSIIPQLVSAYHYPNLCARRITVERLFTYFFLFSLSCNMLGWISCFAFQPMFEYIFGRSMFLSWLVSVLLFFFGNHGINFFGQTVGRSLGLQKELAFAYGFSAIVGTVILAICIYLLGPSVKLLAVSIGAFKSCYLVVAPFLIGKIPNRVLVVSVLLCTLNLVSGILVIFVMAE